MLISNITCLILCCGFILFIFLGDVFIKKLDEAGKNYRKKKHPQIFSYINSYNSLAQSCIKVFKKEYLPNLKKIDYYYDNIKYFPQNGMKSRQLELERQKQLLQDAREDMEKIWDDAQEYYELIKNYAKAHKILWVDEYLDGFPPF